MSDVIAIVLGIAALMLVGCERPRGLVPVEGRVTFRGNAPPTSGYLYFIPRDMVSTTKGSSSAPRLGTAEILPDGTFRAGTFREGDGLRPGIYEIRLECSDALTVAEEVDHAKAHMGPVAVKNHVPNGFQPPDLVVSSTSSKPVRVTIDVP